MAKLNPATSGSLPVLCTLTLTWLLFLIRGASAECRKVTASTTVYAGPCYTFPSVASVSTSATVDYTGWKAAPSACTDSYTWALVNWPIGGSGVGYIADVYLAYCTTSASSCRRVTGSVVNIRAGPCVTYDAIGSVNLGQQLTYWGVKYTRDSSCTSQPTLWARIAYPSGSSGIGYIDSANLAYCRAIDKASFITKYKAAYGSLSASQESGLTSLLSRFEADTTITSVCWVAYMLATVKHECANTWQPIEEYGKGAGKTYGNPVTVTDPQTNTRYTNVYYGRGYVQLTWASNYLTMSNKLGIRMLYYTPSLALDPATAYSVMTAGMRDGSFTGVGLGTYLTSTSCDYYNARRVINGLDRAALIQGYALKIDEILRATTTGLS